MRTIMIALWLLVPCVLCSCASKAGTAGVGVLGGAAAGGGAYEYRLHQELQRLEDDLKAKKIDQNEYDIRKDEVERIRLLK